MKTLDCETKNTIYSSLENILEIDRHSIDSSFEDLDIEKFLEDNPNSEIEPRALVFNRVSSKPLLTIAFDNVCWFHLSRIPKSNTLLENGILPLNRTIDSIWNFLYSLVENRLSKDEWFDFRKTLIDHHHAYLYSMKVNDSLHWGPYAILIREIALKSKEVGNHDYLRVPEIVEDICLCFKEKYGFDLLAAYSAKTRPCIVKFVDSKPRSDCLTTALYYLYCCYRGYELSTYCNTCFDNNGEPILPESILKIEWL